MACNTRKGAPSTTSPSPTSKPSGRQTTSSAGMSNPELISKVLRPKIAGGALQVERRSSLTVHEVDPFSAKPDELVCGRKQTTKAWLFLSPVRRSTRRYKRKIDGAGELSWHPESRKKNVDDNGVTVGHVTKLSWVLKEKSGKKTSQGWIMSQLECNQKHEGDQLALFVLYRSPNQAAAQESPPMEQEPIEAARAEAWNSVMAATGFTVVMKFGSSSLASADRMRKVADVILGVPDDQERPVVILSAMGNTTYHLLQAGHKAVSCSAHNISEIPELAAIKKLHLETVDELGLDRSLVSGLLDELEWLLNFVAGSMHKLAGQMREYLASFGARISTLIVSAYCNKLGRKMTRKHDAFKVNTVLGHDDFTNADSLDACCPSVGKRLLDDITNDPAIPIVTGSGRCDLTAVSIGNALGLREIQIWKFDVEGVLTCDPNICGDAIPIPCLRFDEAAQDASSGAKVLHPQSIQLAKDCGMRVIVKSLDNPQAPGTLITADGTQQAATAAAAAAAVSPAADTRQDDMGSFWDDEVTGELNVTRQYTYDFQDPCYYTF